MSEEININVNLDDLSDFDSESDNLNPFHEQFQRMRERLDSQESILQQLTTQSSPTDFGNIFGSIGSVLGESLTSVIGGLIGGPFGALLGGVIGGSVFGTTESGGIVGSVVAGFQLLSQELDSLIKSIINFSTDLTISKVNRDILFTTQSISFGQTFGPELSVAYDAQTAMLLELRELRANFFSTISPIATLGYKIVELLATISNTFIETIRDSKIFQIIQSAIQRLIELVSDLHRWALGANNKPNDLDALEDNVDQLFAADAVSRLFPTPKKRK